MGIAPRITGKDLKGGRINLKGIVTKKPGQGRSLQRSGGWVQAYIPESFCISSILLVLQDQERLQRLSEGFSNRALRDCLQTVQVGETHFGKVAQAISLPTP